MRRATRVGPTPRSPRLGPVPRASIVGQHRGSAPQRSSPSPFRPWSSCTSFLDCNAVRARRRRLHGPCWPTVVQVLSSAQAWNKDEHLAPPPAPLWGSGATQEGSATSGGVGMAASEALLHHRSSADATLTRDGRSGEATTTTKGYVPCGDPVEHPCARRGGSCIALSLAALRQLAWLTHRASMSVSSRECTSWRTGRSLKKLELEKYLGIHLLQNSKHDSCAVTAFGASSFFGWLSQDQSDEFRPI